MKIIKHRGPRRPYQSPIAEEPPCKKALLIGINYKTGKDSGSGQYELHTPHRDVYDMRDLLIKHYGYDDANITMLLDDGKSAEKQPTQSNIIREIKKLVKDAKSGDRFFFQYSGHVGQVENKNNSEEDGMDECLIPCDHNNEHNPRMITDNELRRHLVDTLPIGSSLVAVFDSCHSASLLDLDHFRCNRVYVPWISKGRRRSDSIWNRNGMNLDINLQSRPLNTDRTVRRQAMLNRSVYQTKRVSRKVVKSKKTSIGRIADPNVDVHIKATRRLSIKSTFEKDDRWLDDTELSPIPRCDSPIAIWPCEGFCQPSDAEFPRVISLGACKDDQLSWEDSRGASMTRALIEILKKDPHPSLKDLMTNVSHEVHKASLNVHKEVKTYKKRMKEWRRAKERRGQKAAVSVSDDVPVLEMDNFQDPQVRVLDCLSIR
ncbi:caspase domain-containing protein [Desarmillaria tabescens]|uniref:Caspase domain-containing protein n=1 Tax=Armillaria tabescens TaxID=1929756 RepID=A0AA39JR21_ARMTA|nr:caspase domain-containing protein [Desarmillaria tabescens]KAK0445003.1 caspase domain-containing protein [Desarmillaria tabescens]